MYNAYVIKIKNVTKHSNADRLQVGTCFGNQVIVSLETKDGDLGIYFPTDGQLSIEYCEANNLLIKKDENGTNIGGYLDPKKRHIRTLKLRGEISDGLFMPILSLESMTNTSKLKEGDVVNLVNGIEICKKYIPIRNNSSKVGDNKTKQPKKEKRIKYPTFSEHIDTSQLMYNLQQFKSGDICYITLKIHGTSARTMYSIKEEKIKTSLIKRVLTNNKFSVDRSWEYVSGTRRVVLENYDGGYYGSNGFRIAHHNKFIDKLQKGETAYYEIVGFQGENRPIMGTVSNKKTQDKEFIKKYGETTTYSYGCQNGESDIYIYRMSITNEDGFEIDYPWDMVKLRAEQIGVKVVPEFDRFIFTTQEDLLNRVNTYLEGQDPIGITHIREGVVVRVEGKDKFKAYKHKGFYFKLLEGIIKDAGIVDEEESQELGEE